MMKYLFAFVALFVICLPADAQRHGGGGHHNGHHGGAHNRNHHGRGGHRVFASYRNYNFLFTHRAGVTLYGTYADYQEVGLAVVGYTDLVAVQTACGQVGFQIVATNTVSSFVVVTVPSTVTWSGISGFSGRGGVRFIEPHRHNRR